jgi:PAS domain S-box-containing protein
MEAELSRVVHQEAQRESEHQLRRAIDTFPTLAWCNLPDGTNEFLNKKWHQYTGLSPDESHGWGWQAAFHPEDLPALMEKWLAMLASGEPDEIEARLRRHDGTYRWFLIRAEPFRDESGSVIRWYGTSTDIDDRKRAEEALRARELQLRQVLDTIPSLIQVLRPDGRAMYVNQAVLDYSGLNLGDVQKEDFRSRVFHPDDVERLREERRLALARAVPFENEQRVLGKDGQYRWFLIRFNPWLDEQGKIVQWYAAGTDITDRKQAEEKLARSEALLTEGQHLARIGNFSWRVTNDEIVWSEQLYRIFEFEEGTRVTLDLIGSRVHPDDIQMLNDMIQRARHAVSDFEYEHRLLLPDQSVKHLHLIAHGIRDNEGRLEYLGAVQDVTQRRISEEALSKARNELAHVARVMTLGALTASIAHEVNQPLSGIVTNASTCLRMLSSDPPNIEGARETARRTIRDGNRASDVITRLRALFSKKEPAIEQVDLNDAAQEVIALSLSDLQRNRVIVRPEFAHDLPLIAGDRVQLQQVILNLLRNASDAMSTVTDRPRELFITTERVEGDQVRFTVRDVGVGFSPQSLSRLFDAFYTTKSNGMGIGLSLSRSIVESHDGRLWAAPNGGPGATFCFSIPCRSESSKDADSSAASNAA